MKFPSVRRSSVKKIKNFLIFVSKRIIIYEDITFLFHLGGL